MNKSILALGVSLGLAMTASSALAATCTGECGTLGPDGVVTASPAGPTYGYVATAQGVNGAGEIAGVGGTNGSEYTLPFSANAGDMLSFYFNYVTSDGSGYADYGWSELQDSLGNHVAWLFTARTVPSGNTSPGFGLPANDSTLIPFGAPVIPGGVTWSPLNPNQSPCYAAGCGYTGWIQSLYTIANAGNYQLVFGVTNWADTAWQTGLAFNGELIGGVPIGTPEPATWALMMTGVFGVGAVLRASRRKAALAA